MWKFYFQIITGYLKNDGVFDDLISQASVPLINFMDKAPDVFRDQPMMNGLTPLAYMFEFIQKVLKDGKALEDEIHSMCAVTLIMALLEHVPGLDQHIHTINQIYLNEINDLETQNYKNMITQGIMMLFHYNLTTTF